MVSIVPLIQLVILFFVIIDPLASFIVFFAASKDMSKDERRTTAWYAIFLATGLSYAVILLGQKLLLFFSTNIDEFKVAGGIILTLLGIKMTLGMSLSKSSEEKSAGTAIAAIIATPLLTGPAAITAIIINVAEYGMILTATAVTIILALTAILFLEAEKVRRYIGPTAIQVISTILGLVTVAWGVQYIAEGARVMFLA